MPTSALEVHYDKRADVGIGPSGFVIMTASIRKDAAYGNFIFGCCQGGNLPPYSQ